MTIGKPKKLIRSKLKYFKSVANVFINNITANAYIDGDNKIVIKVESTRGTQLFCSRPFSQQEWEDFQDRTFYCGDSEELIRCFEWIGYWDKEEILTA